jgi:hypothetical protein
VVCQERLAQRQSGEHCTFARKANRTGLRRYRCDCSTPLPSATYNQPFVNDYEKPLIHTEVEHLGEAGFTDISRDRQSGTYAADYIIAGHRGASRVVHGVAQVMLAQAENVAAPIWTDLFLQ